MIGQSYGGGKIAWVLHDGDEKRRTDEVGKTGPAGVAPPKTTVAARQGSLTT